VYRWVDGIYFNVRLSDERPCMLVFVGVLPDGKKELVGLLDGERESKLSWKEFLLDLKRSGLDKGPEVVVADGGLGFRAALEEVFPGAREERCRVHKTANILDKMPKNIQPSAKRLIQEMNLSPTKREALGAFDGFLSLYAVKFPKAGLCLEKDKHALFTFYDFPAAHWQYLRTTNPIEFSFATVRHRARQTKGCGSRTATLSMVSKLAREAEKKWRRLNGCEQVVKVMTDTPFVDGEEQATQRLAA